MASEMFWFRTSYIYMHVHKKFLPWPFGQTDGPQEQQIHSVPQPAEEEEKKTANV